MDDQSKQPSQELGTNALDVAECVREARRRIEGQPQADDAGQAVPGNARAMRVGDRSVQLQSALAPVRDAIEQATLSDLGYPPDGPERPPEALRITARNMASLDVLAETFWTWIEQQGVLTAKGKTRSAVMTLLSIIDRQTKLASVIGLQRRAKPIQGGTIRDFAAELRQQEQQPTTTGD